MIETITLENGVRIFFEHIPHVRSVSFGLWFSVGSRFETSRENGASHFIEHMLFKGTQTKTAAEIAAQMDEVGGQMNAFTTKEATCFYGRVLDQNLRKSVDLLADMLFHSRFLTEDIDAERQIIFEEIDMYEDSPDDLVSELLLEAVFPNTALGRPILGTKESLSGFDRDLLLAYKNAHFTGNRLVVALSGNFTPSDITHISETFAALPAGKEPTGETVAFTPAFVLREKDIEQNHLCLLLPGLHYNHESRYTAQLLSNILGGGMSSRLFQELREDLGLCYSIYSFGASYHDAGAFGVYLALNHENEEKALRKILEILGDLKKKGVTEEELARANSQVKTSVLLSLESTSARMNRMGRNALHRGTIPTAEEILARYDAVTPDDIANFANALFDFEQLSFSAVGKTSTAEQYRSWLF